MMKMRSYLSVFLAGLFFGLGLGVEQVEARPAIRFTPNGGVDWSEGVIFAVGRGVAPGRLQGKPQEQLMARRAAVVDAYRNLAEITQGVHIVSDKTIQDEMVSSVHIKATVNALIKGAEVVGEKFEGGVATVKMAMPIAGRMMQTLIPRDKFQHLVREKGFSQRRSKPFSLVDWLLSPFQVSQAHASKLPLFPFENDQEVQTARKILDWFTKKGLGVGLSTLQESITAHENQARFTGVVVDASLVPRFEMATVPFLKTADGTAIYPNPETDYNHVVKNRVASYDFDVQDAMRNNRVSDLPFVIKALSIYKSKTSDLVISPEDAARVRRLSSLAQNLTKTRVIIVVAE